MIESFGKTVIPVISEIFLKFLIREREYHFNLLDSTNLDSYQKDVYICFNLQTI